MPAFIIEELCQGCQRCVDTCASHAISVFARVATVKFDKCIECEECVEVCMHGAITFRQKSIEHLEKELHIVDNQLKDLKARWPAHSLKPAMLSELEDLEEKRNSLKRLVDERGH